MAHRISHISRRGLLGSAAGAAAVTSLAGCAHADGHGSAPDFDDPAQFLTAMIKMRGAIDGSLAMGWIYGTRYAVIDNKATPVFGILAATFFQYSRVDALTFEMRMLEMAYFTDLATGKHIETWDNPFTVQTVEVPLTRMGPSLVKVKPGGFDLTDNPRMQNMEANHMFRPAIVAGDDVWVTEEIRIAGDPPATGPQPFRYNELTTYNASLADLSDPDRVRVPTKIQYQSLVGWGGWAGMDGLNAMNMGRGSGRTEARVEDLPPYYLELCEKHHPDVINDPLAALQQPRGE
jgi:hypothetical protein